MQRYFSNKKNNDYFILNDNDLYHIKTVMRMHDKEKIEVVFKENVYICELEFVNGEIKIKELEKIDSNIKNKVEISLAIPVLKEQKMDLIIQKSTELGVNRIIPFISERGIVKINSENENKKVTRWQKIAKEASEQSKRIDVPVVENVKQISDLISYNGKKLVCSTKNNVNNVKYLLQNSLDCDKLIIVIGPEGGLSNFEEDFLVKNNFLQVSLGSRIMRVETVPLFILSVLDYEFME